MTFDNETFSRYLKSRMALAGIRSYDELADKSGVSLASVTDYMRGASGPLLSTACKLADALGCTVNDLCGYGDDAR